MTDSRPADALVLRRAVQADAPDIAALVAAAYGHYVQRIGRLPKPMTADQLAAVGQHEVWVLVDSVGGSLAGVLELIVAPDHLFIEDVAVAPDRQGIGLGSRLLDHAETEARRRGLPEIRLETNERFVENLAIYARRGYRETGRRAYLGSDVVELAKPIMSS